VGVWLSIFAKRGIDDILGVDGKWLAKKYLQIAKEKFLSHDLRKSLKIDRQFDLVISLEVAEHLPAECADDFVDSLVKLGPVVLFSAAVPMQGGISHLNEQWPDYWSKRFQAKGYVTVDAIRKKIWQKDISSIYTQNMLIFAQKDYLEKQPLLKKELDNTFIEQLSVIHPRFYLYKIDPREAFLGQTIAALPVLLMNWLKQKLRIR